MPHLLRIRVFGGRCGERQLGSGLRGRSGGFIAVPVIVVSLLAFSRVRGLQESQRVEDDGQ